MPHLDVYDERVVDDEEYDMLPAEARAAAEREMRKRDRQEALAQGRMRPGLLYGRSAGKNFNPSVLHGCSKFTHSNVYVTCELFVVF